MKILQYLLLSLIALVAPTFVSAQISEDNLPTAELKPFTAITIDASMELTLVEIGENESPKLVYDLADNDATKFNFDVNSKKVLNISQNRNVKGVNPVRATLYYRGVNKIEISGAIVRLATPFNATTADITMIIDANFIGEVNCSDLDLNIATKSRAELRGNVKYLTLKASTGAKAMLRELKSTSTNVVASNNAYIEFSAGERAILNVSTKASIKYWNTPEILRQRQGTIGGEIIPQDM